jgi:hypothetical protein
LVLIVIDANPSCARIIRTEGTAYTIYLSNNVKRRIGFTCCSLTKTHVIGFLDIGDFGETSARIG